VAVSVPGSAGHQNVRGNWLHDSVGIDVAAPSQHARGRDVARFRAGFHNRKKDIDGCGGSNKRRYCARWCIAYAPKEKAFTSSPLKILATDNAVKAFPRLGLHTGPADSFVSVPA
jgi:hypothetical protein